EYLRPQRDDQVDLQVREPPLEVREVGVQIRRRKLQGLADEDERADTLAERDRHRQIDEEPRVRREVAEPGVRTTRAVRELEGDVALVEQAEIEQQLLGPFARPRAARERLEDGRLLERAGTRALAEGEPAVVGLAHVTAGDCTWTSTTSFVRLALRTVRP